jgi:hypothetical protein
MVMILPINFMSSTRPGGHDFRRMTRVVGLIFRHVRRLDTLVLGHKIWLFSATADADFTLSNSVLTNRRAPGFKDLP